MTRTLTVTVLLVFTSLPLKADNPDGNPFKKLGHKVDIATFSDNQEFHDQSRFIQIGSVWFDTEENEVVGLVQEKDTLIEFVPELISTTIDPHCEKYYSVTPYGYCFNNPLRFIDPDGRDVWEINDEGRIINRIEDKTQDAFYMVDKDGNRTYKTNDDGNKVYNSITFEYGTITAVRHPKVNSLTSENKKEERALTLFDVKGDSNAKQLFEFFAHTKNTKVEWTHAKIGSEKSEKNIIGTSNSESSTPVGHYLRQTNYTLKEVNHNHPSGIPRPSLGDIAGSVHYRVVFPDIKLQIYTHKDKKYTQYYPFRPPKF